METIGIESFQLSLAARVPQPTIYRTLSGRSVPRPETLHRLCRTLGLRIEEVLLIPNGPEEVHQEVL